MRPLKLTMEAFGAYKKLETIDFTELGTERIFVISGKTGAGKSTIFDAISFAIFGVTNLADREGASMRSDFACDRDLTEVTLTFMLHQKTYYIKRSPQQEIRKARGDGMRSLNQKAELYELTGGEEKLLASSVRDVKVKMEELIQLNVDQFRQILMIPQGEFRELLVSDSKEKEAILQRLAHTDFYKRVENLLFEKQKNLQMQAENTRRELWDVIATEFDDDSLSVSEVEARFEAKIAEQKTELLEKQNELSSLQKISLSAAQNVAVAEGIEADFAQLEKQNELLTELYAQKTDMERHKSRLAKMKAAHNLQPFFGQLKRTDEKLGETKREFEQNEADLKTAEAELSKWEEEKLALTSKQERAEKWRRNKMEFEKMLPKMEQLTKNVTSLETKKAAFKIKELAFKEQETNFGQLTQEMTSLKERLEALSTILEERFHLLEQINEFEMNHKQITENLTKTRQLFEMDQQLFDLKQKKEVYRAELDRVEHIKDDLFATSKKEQAAVLAQHLHEGDACPVCGSEKHPALATFSKKFQMEDLEQALQDVEEHTVRLKEVEEQMARIVWQKEQWEGLDGRDVEKWQEEHTRITSKLEKAKQKQSQLNESLKLRENLKNELTKKEQLKQELTNKLTDLQMEKDQLKRDIELLDTEISWLLTDIPESLRKPEDFHRIHKQVLASLAEFEAHEKTVLEGLETQKNIVSEYTARQKSITEQLAKLSKELANDQTVFEEKRVQLGLNDEAEFHTYLAQIKDIPAIEKELSDYERSLYVAVDRKQVLEEKLKGAEKKDLVKLQKELDEAKNHQSEAEQKMLVVRERGNETNRHFELFISKKAQLLHFEEEYADLGLLADTARGKNDLRITFERYVLATFLDTIVSRANVRLLKMTNGRFELSRKRDKAKGNAQSGLELEVYDEYTGMTRHVKTLSGGESFKTSLALALALAEVVQEMAGGISLDTMFIDEGFGTLDPESLDMAIECLLETQENGRLVGIISHVPELKERIPARLEVTATNQGSKTQFVLNM